MKNNSDSSAFAGDHPAKGGVGGRRKNDGTASADSARKFSADEPGEAQSESIWAKTGHKRYHGHGRGAPFGHIGVLMGGCSSEREISLKSGKGVLRRLKNTVVM